MDHMQQRLFLHKYIYSEYMSKYLQLLSEDMPCFSVLFMPEKLSISLKIKKTEFRRRYRNGLMLNLIYPALEQTFILFLKNVSESTDSEFIKNGISNIIESNNYRLLQSVTLHDGGDIIIHI